MRFTRPFALKLLAALLAPTAVGWFVGTTYFPCTDAQRRAASLAVPLALVVNVALVLLAVAAAVRPIERVLGERGAGRGLVERASSAALRLPARGCGVAVSKLCRRADGDQREGHATVHVQR